ncbi:hypothetical protein R1sor_024483 [Riccia sorocarpa]|uniref:Uncharacterized protein n=1 Tax=Riccia sorocarpa TaxID=122646 RepID=A0ABD3GQL9_9MARC
MVETEDDDAILLHNDDGAGSVGTLEDDPAEDNDDDPEDDPEDLPASSANPAEDEDPGVSERVIDSLPRGLKGMVDEFFCAASRVGVRFTRIAKKESRVVWSRLDRIYLTNGALWVDHREITRHSSNTLSDHALVSMTIQLEPDRRKKIETYFKMSWQELKDPIVLQKSARAKEKQQEGDLEAEIEWRKARLTEHHSEVEVEALARVEKRAKEKVLGEAREWRTRSRIKWLSEDEAPSKFFFAKLRAKWARESIEALENEEGAVLTENEEILDEIHDFYQGLCSAESESPEGATAMEEVLQLMQRRKRAEVCHKSLTRLKSKGCLLWQQTKPWD